MIRTIALTLATVATTALTANAAMVDVGYDLSTESTFEQDAGNYIDAVVANNGDLPTSPESIDADKIITPDILFWTATITREENENSEIKLQNVRWDRSSDDTGDRFADSGSFVTNDYSDGDSLIGLQAGPDNQLFTEDDIEVTDGDADVDFIGIYGEGRNFANNEANRTYFNAETPFEVETTVDLTTSFNNAALATDSKTVTVEGEAVVPTPSTWAMAIVGFGTLALSRSRSRRRR